MTVSGLFPLLYCRPSLGDHKGHGRADQSGQAYDEVYRRVSACQVVQGTRYIWADSSEHEPQGHKDSEKPVLLKSGARQKEVDIHPLSGWYSYMETDAACSRYQFVFPLLFDLMLQRMNMKR